MAAKTKQVLRQSLECEKPLRVVDVTHRWHDRMMSRIIASEVVGHQLPGLTSLTLKQTAEEPFSRTLMPTVEHLNHVYANNRAEVSHEPTRQRERAMRGFRSSDQAQRFLTLHGLTQNLFRLGRHLREAVNYRILQARAFQV